MTYRQLQLTDPDSIAQLTQHFDRLDVLVNNAGANFSGDLMNRSRMVLTLRYSSI
ncbi:putative 3-oxoacyl-[acyl-carrier-protein] reductase [Mycobacterium ulcerans str. Harvey]|uniref:3-oxoacyl-[acyl-carrier-protein] reductase n=1 Tax=Mycobacterium ulcerans str. Harvey TaxID=1299332 RepID=A0ABP3A5H5_MYCUL|nr:putative 3-oxoacyl-[acyl-carrier-protein] reductase [Mycobacterium ulcerans str. Harvey]